MSIRFKSVALAGIFAMGMIVSQCALAAEKLDAQLEAAAKCTVDESMPATMAAYRLLLSSKLVAKERSGKLTYYMAAVEPNSNVKVWGLSPTRVTVAETQGYSLGLVVAMYSETFPLSELDILSAYQGGLKHKLVMSKIASPQLAGLGMPFVGISTDPVYKNRYLIAGTMGNGDRVVACAPIEEIKRFIN